MWLSLIERSETLLAVYKDDVPTLENIALHEIKILTGEDVIVKVNLELSKLPNDMPKKWVLNKVNSVQICLDLIHAEIEAFELGTAVATVSNVEIQDVQGGRRVAFMNASKKEVLVINATWIYLTSMNGYHSTSDN